MDKTQFSWASHFEKDENLCEFLEISEPKAILERIYGPAMAYIEQEEEYMEYYLKVAKQVKKCHKKLKHRVDPSILYEKSKSRQALLDPLELSFSSINPANFKKFMEHVFQILVDHDFPLLNPAKRAKNADFFTSFLQNDPEEIRYFNPPFDYVSNGCPARGKAGSPILQKCQAIFLFFYIADFLKRYITVVTAKGERSIELRPFIEGVPIPRADIEKEISLSRASTSNSTESVGAPAGNSASGLRLVLSEGRTKVAFSWKECIEGECHLIEEVGYASTGRLARLIYGRECFEALHENTKAVCLSLAQQVQHGHFEIFRRKDLGLLYVKHSRGIGTENLFSFMQSSLKRLATAGFPFVSAAMVERAANFLAILVKNPPKLIRAFYPSPLFHKDFNPFSVGSNLTKAEVLKMADCHTLFLFHYMTQFIRKFVTLTDHDGCLKLELKPKKEAAWTVYFDDPDMIIFSKLAPTDVKCNRLRSKASSVAFCWKEYLSQPCVLFEEVQSLTPKSLTDLIFGDALSDVLLNTKEVCTAIARKISKNHSHLFIKMDLDLLYYKDSETLHRGMVFHFLKRSLKRIAASNNERSRPLLTVSDIHAAALFFVELLFTPTVKSAKIDLSPIFLKQGFEDFSKKEAKHKTIDILRNMSVFFFDYMLSYFRKLVTLSPDGSNLILLPKETVATTVYASRNAKKYFSNFALMAGRKFLEKQESMLKQFLTASGDYFCQTLIGSHVFEALTEEGKTVLSSRVVHFLEDFRELIKVLSDRSVFREGFSEWPQKDTLNKTTFSQKNLQWLMDRITAPFTAAFENLIPEYNREQLNKNIVESISRIFFKGTKLLKTEVFEFVPHECPFIDNLGSMIKEEHLDETGDMQRAAYFNSLYFYAFYVLSWVLRFGCFKSDSDEEGKERLKTRSLVECKSLQEEMRTWLEETKNFDPSCSLKQDEERPMDDEEDMECLGIFEKPAKEPLWTMELGSSDDEKDTVKSPPRLEKKKKAVKVKEEPETTTSVAGKVRKIKQEPTEAEIGPGKKIKQEAEEDQNEDLWIVEVKRKKRVKVEKEPPVVPNKRIKEEPQETSKKKVKSEPS